MTHFHHIVPRHAGGSDHPSNLVEVSIAQHAQLHKELWEANGAPQDYLAYRSLSGQISKEEVQRERSRIGGLSRKGIPRSKGAVEKMIATRTENDLWKVTDETKHRISVARFGQCRSLSSCEKQAATNSSQWKITLPNGSSVHVTNLKKFSRENGLSPGTMHNLYTGKKANYRGYRVEKVT